MPRKTINVGRVKGSMWYSGTNPQEIKNPLEDDMFLHTDTFVIYQYTDSIWTPIINLKHAVSSNYVVKEEGKGLSSNDFTDILLNKLLELNNYNDEEIRHYIDELNINKANTEDVPTKLSQLENDNSFITNTANNLLNYYLKTETYTKQEVLNLVGQISTMSMKVVNTLPTTNISTTTIYLIPISNSSNNNYEEYIYVNNQWELIGTTKVDLSNYVVKEEGKGLSSNDFTDGEKSKLSNLQNYDDTAIKQNISDLQNNKADRLELFSKDYNELNNKPKIPEKVSELLNDSGFITKEIKGLTNYYDKDYLDSVHEDLWNSAGGFIGLVVEEGKEEWYNPESVDAIKLNNMWDQDHWYSWYYNNKFYIMTTYSNTSNYDIEQHVFDLINSKRIKRYRSGTTREWTITIEDIPTIAQIHALLATKEKLQDLGTCTLDIFDKTYNTGFWWEHTSPGSYYFKYLPEGYTYKIMSMLVEKNTNGTFTQYVFDPSTNITYIRHFDGLYWKISTLKNSLNIGSTSTDPADISNELLNSITELGFYYFTYAPSSLIKKPMLMTVRKEVVLIQDILDLNSGNKYTRTCHNSEWTVTTDKFAKNSELNYVNDRVTLCFSSLDVKANTEDVPTKLSQLENDLTLTKADIGLNNVDNTSDVDKPISTAAQTELDKINSLINELRTLINNNSTLINNVSTEAATNKTDIDKLEEILTSDDTDLDTLQELVNALKNNTSNINDIFTQIAKKVDKTTTVNGHALDSNVTVTKSDVGLGNVLNVPSYSKTETDELLSAKAASSTLTSHTSNTSNPHSVTKAQVGLGNVLNVSSYSKTETDNLLSGKATTTTVNNHINNKSNPHAVTKAQVGLGNVLNVASYSKTEVDNIKNGLLRLTSIDYTPGANSNGNYVFNITKMKNWGVYLFSLTFKDASGNRVVQTTQIYMRDAEESGYYLSTPFYYYDGSKWDMCMLFCWRDNGITIELRSVSDMDTQKSFDMYTLLRVKELQQG